MIRAGLQGFAEIYGRSLGFGPEGYNTERPNTLSELRFRGMHHFFFRRPTNRSLVKTEDVIPRRSWTIFDLIRKFGL